MKPSVPKGDGKKRKREEAPAPVESPKRSKVHAQRKFAQGVGIGAPISPIKEREKILSVPRNVTQTPEPIITNRVPNTEDFLTFLCFQRTSMLPPELNFFRETAIASPAVTATQTQPNQTQPRSGKPSVKKKEKKVSPEEKTPTAVQALRRKYKEQRIAKQKATSVTTLAKKVKGKNLVRTRSTTVAEDAVKTTKVVKRGLIGLRSGLQRSAPAPVAVTKKQKQKKLLRAGLRSGGRHIEPKNPTKENKKELSPVKKKQETVVQTQKAESKPGRRRKLRGEHGSDFSSDDNEPLLQKGPSRPSFRTRSRLTKPLPAQRPGRPVRQNKISATSVENIAKRPVNPAAEDEQSSADNVLEPRRQEKRESDLKAKITLKKGASIGSKRTTSSTTKGLVKKVVAKSSVKADKPRSVENSPSRPSTRSRSQDEKVDVKLSTFLKPAIRNLIQRKKQKSLRTLTRLRQTKQIVRFGDKILKKSVNEKPGIKSIKGKAKAIMKSEKIVEQTVRKLRGKEIAVSEKSENIAEKRSKVKNQELRKKPVAVAKTKKAVGKPKQKIEVSVSGLSKRPVRKCSTIDKIWIDIDGFTSDEDDFIDIESIAEGKSGTSSTKKSAEDSVSEGSKNISSTEPPAASDTSLKPKEASQSSKTQSAGATQGESQKDNSKGTSTDVPKETTTTEKVDSVANAENSKGSSVKTLSHEGKTSKSSASQTSTVSATSDKVGPVSKQNIDTGMQSKSQAKSASDTCPSNEKSTKAKTVAATSVSTTTGNSSTKNPSPQASTLKAAAAPKRKNSKLSRETIAAGPPSNGTPKTKVTSSKEAVVKSTILDQPKTQSQETVNNSDLDVDLKSSSAKDSNLTPTICNTAEKATELKNASISPSVPATSTPTPSNSTPSVPKIPVSSGISAVLAQRFKAQNSSTPSKGKDELPTKIMEKETPRKIPIPSKPPVKLFDEKRRSPVTLEKKSAPISGKSKTVESSVRANQGSNAGESSTAAPAINNKLLSTGSNSLIARLAASISMSSNPSKLNYDCKPLAKDLKNIEKCSDTVKEEFDKRASNTTLKLEDSFSTDDKKDLILPLSGRSSRSFKNDIKEDIRDSTKVTPKILPKLTATFIPRGFEEKSDAKPTSSKLEPNNASSSEKMGDIGRTSEPRIKGKKNSKSSQSLFRSNLRDESSSDSDYNDSPRRDKRNHGLSDIESSSAHSSGFDTARKRKSRGKTVKEPSPNALTGKKSSFKREEKKGDGSVRGAKNSRGGRIARPRPTPEVTTRKERPKRQCSTMRGSWIDRDSDDSSFYDDDEEDYLELIRQAELAEREKERAKERLRKQSTSDSDVASKRAETDNFSDSDDEPLKKKSKEPESTQVQDSPETPCVEDVGTSANRIIAETQVQQSCDMSVMVLPPPINTHGLDLLSEVVTEREKSSSRIEQWLKESVRTDNATVFRGFDASEIQHTPMPTRDPPFNIPDPLVQFVRATADAPRLLVPEDSEKQVKRTVGKPEPVLKRPPVSSVQDLLKLQKERRETPKPSPEHHLANCKCNNCVVKKAWFKNKPMPENAKSIAKDSPSVKPFQTLSKAFGGSSSGKASASVAPFIQTPESPDSKSSGPQRKMSFLERMRERERKEAAAAKPFPSAFSPSNESSVYAFEPEPEQSTPLRRSTTPRTSGASASDTDEERSRHQSASIAVQVNLDSMDNPPPDPSPVVDDGKSIEISTQTEGAEDDSDTMFYIPLQQSTNIASAQPMIQGVALKLGTEGPLGPNQRVIMKAKLVTKAPSVKAVVMPQPKATTPKTTLPVGTVQPTARQPLNQPANLNPNSREETQTAISTRAKKVDRSEEAVGTNAKIVESPAGTNKTTSTSPANDTAKSNLSTKCSSPPVKRSEAKKGDALPSALVEAPTFYLTEKEFQDPLEFFERIRPEAERFGLCRIVPPTSFKPDCKVADDMRFTAYNQYVHRLFHRWGPSVRETMAMKKYLKTQRISLKPPPCIGGIEVDLPRLYKAVQTCGGLMKVMEKQKWQHVADMLRIPRAAHDLSTKLDAIYCQYLLPYDTLKPEEREQLLTEVAADWEANVQKETTSCETEGEDEDEDENYIEECEECIVKGRNMALSQFYRIARNTMSMWFSSSEPSPADVETEFWRKVTDPTHHVCVHSGSIDSSGWGYGFPVGKNNFAKHPWNLKVLTNNSGSVLRSLGPVMGVTVPTLHVGMVFTAFCWYRDPHGLPWVEYLHTGAPKIWYGISDDNSELFREALTKLMPRHIKDQRIWLPCDTAMAPPERLVELGVPLSRTTQEPGQFVLIFPRAFTSSLCTGYLVSESVYFARPSWLDTAEQVFKDIHDSAEPSVFSLDNLLFSIAADTRASLEVLQLVLPMVQRIRQRELDGRKALQDVGVSSERLQREVSRRKGKSSQPESEQECEQCRASLFLSLLKIVTDDTAYCLTHGLQYLTTSGEQKKNSKILYTHDEDEINQVVDKLEERIGVKLNKGKK